MAASIARLEISVDAAPAQAQASLVLALQMAQLLDFLLQLQHLAPQLANQAETVGIEAEVLHQPQQAFDYGIFDAIFSPATFLEDSLRWADGVLNGTIKVERKNEPGRIERSVKWPVAIKMARGMLESRIGTMPRSPYVALELLEKARSGTSPKDRA